MGNRWSEARIATAFLGLAVLACGGNSEFNRRNGGTGGDTTATGGQASGGGGAGGVSGGGSPSVECSAGAARCNAAGVRESCTPDGLWSTTDFVCAANVAVDDETGSYCITKRDGKYRCWGREMPEALPTESYRRVQLAAQGIVGLTEDGRLLAVGIDLPADIPRAVSFRATNMFSYQAVCPLLEGGAFWTISHIPEGAIEPIDPVRVAEGTFSRAFCVYEGFAIGVRTDGSVWSNYLGVANGAPSPLPGNDWMEIAHSVGILCAIKTSGEIACAKSVFDCVQEPNQPCEPFDPPTFPPGRYLAVTATGAVVCALDDAGELVCKRYDGTDMPIAPGPYTFVEGGRDVICAVRVDGSVACFRHGGEGWLGDIGELTQETVDSAW